MPPNCQHTPCGSPERKPRLDRAGRTAHRAWRYCCRLFHCLPEKGTLDDQNPALLHLMDLCDQVHRNAEAQGGSHAVQALLAAFGAKGLFGG